mmetsp:Transcript_18430/g.58737  ORF Transcript_18430/g.58737 Transcript_18430/m.58737 type:complete len:270 (-) Transcript_18430:221-1030(-)
MLVVRNNNDGTVEARESESKGRNSLEIKVVCGLVHDQHVRRRAGAHVRERDAALLPARAAADQLVGQPRRDPEARQVLARLVLAHARVLGQHVRQRGGVEVQLVHVVLREHSHAQARVPLHVPRRGPQHVHDQAQQGRLAAAVGAKEAYSRLLSDSKVDIVKQRLIRAVPEANVVDLNGWRAQCLWVGEVEREPGVLGQLLQLRQPVERLDARLHERRALGVEAELVDELLHVVALALLGLHRLGVPAQLLCAHALKVVVVAAVVQQLL